MINKKIEVEYLRRRQDGKVALTDEDLTESGQQPWEVDSICLTMVFTLFTIGVK